MRKVSRNAYVLKVQVRLLNFKQHFVKAVHDVWQCYVGCWETPSRKDDIDLRILEATWRRDTVSNSCHYASAKEAAAEAALISLNVLA
jgi:hypothetical protein